jgi:acyl-CoA thioesterase
MKVPGPENLKSQEMRMRSWLETDDPKVKKFHDIIKIHLNEPIRLEVRPVGHKLLGTDSKHPSQMLWIKSNQKLPDDLTFHYCVMAYASDVCAPNN